MCVQVIRRDYSSVVEPVGTVFTYTATRDSFGFVVAGLGMLGLGQGSEKPKVKVMLGVRLLEVVEGTGAEAAEPRKVEGVVGELQPPK